MEQQKSVNLLDLMTPEEKVKVAKNKQNRSELITREWIGLAELGFYFGWAAVRDVIDDKITLRQAHILVDGARRIHSGHVYDQAVAGLAATSTKRGNFQKLMKPYVRDMKVVQ